jgi:hypothetical protein
MSTEQNFPLVLAGTGFTALTIFRQFLRENS